MSIYIDVKMSLDGIHDKGAVISRHNDAEISIYQDIKISY